MKHHLLLTLLALVLAPLTLLGIGAAVEAQDANPVRPGQLDGPMSIPNPSARFSDNLDAHAPAAAPGDLSGRDQVRIRGRVVIRVSPGTRRTRTNMLAELPRREMRTTYAEIEHGDCIRARSLVGIQLSNDDRLMFFMNNGDVLLARLEDGCNVRAFYAGFYADRSNDGQLCADRNRLHSRAGEMCEVAEFTELVAVGT